MSLRASNGHAVLGGDAHLRVLNDTVQVWASMEACLNAARPGRFMRDGPIRARWREAYQPARRLLARCWLVRIAGPWRRERQPSVQADSGPDSFYAARRHPGPGPAQVRSTYARGFPRDPTHADGVQSRLGSARRESRTGYPYQSASIANEFRRSRSLPGRLALDGCLVRSAAHGMIRLRHDQSACRVLHQRSSTRSNPASSTSTSSSSGISCWIGTFLERYRGYPRKPRCRWYASSVRAPPREGPAT